CLKDYIDVSTITIYNVKRLLGRYCGSKVPSPILSMHPKTEIIFRTNHAVSSTGFHGIFTFIDESTVGPPPSTISTIRGCGGIEKGFGGIITTPNYPLAFPRKIDCMWLIRVQQDEHIYLRVVDLQLFGSIANCKDAHLAIYDGYENFDYDPKEPKKYCGDLKYYKSVDDKVELSARNRLLVRFKSDITAPQWEDQVASQETVGFKLVWTAVRFKAKGECPDFLCQSSEFCLNPKVGAKCPQTFFFCIDRSLLCNGVPNCSEQDTTDEDKCAMSILAGAGIGAATLSLLLIICCCCCRRHSRSNGRRRRKPSSGSSKINLQLSDGSMQLRQLEHSPTYGSRPDGLSFFSNSSTVIGNRSQSPVEANNGDMMNCSIHGPRGLLQVPASIHHTAFQQSEFPTDV
ncbi:CUB domain low-density lipoprotein receptor domain class A-like protein, partial [Dinothrombium tinctorium]